MHAPPEMLLRSDRIVLGSLRQALAKSSAIHADEMRRASEAAALRAAAEKEASERLLQRAEEIWKEAAASEVARREKAHENERHAEAARRDAARRDAAAAEVARADEREREEQLRRVEAESARTLAVAVAGDAGGVALADDVAAFQQRLRAESGAMDDLRAALDARLHPPPPTQPPPLHGGVVAAATEPSVPLHPLHAPVSSDSHAYSLSAMAVDVADDPLGCRWDIYPAATWAR